MDKSFVIFLRNSSNILQCIICNMTVRIFLQLEEQWIKLRAEEEEKSRPLELVSMTMMLIIIVIMTMMLIIILYVEGELGLRLRALWSSVRFDAGSRL